MSRHRDKDIEASGVQLNASARSAIRALLSRHAIGENELARRLKIQPATIWQRLNEPEVGMTLTSLARMARVLGYQVELRFNKIEDSDGATADQAASRGTLGQKS